MTCLFRSGTMADFFKKDDISDADLESLLNGIREGNEEAVTRFWELHFERLASLAKRKMSSSAFRAVDEEDIALSAIDSFYKGLAEKRFDSLRYNNELWKLLATIVIRKIAKQRKKHFTQKRGGGRVRGESLFEPGPAAEPERCRGLANVSANQVGPHFEAEFLDTCEAFFTSLNDPTAQEVARLSMEGHSTDEIAETLGCVRRTVERKLKKIRDKWESWEES